MKDFPKPHLWLIRFIGVIVPQRFRARFRQEWGAELQYREELLARWDKLDWRSKLELLWRSLGAFRDALWLQQLRWEDEMTQDLRFGVRMLLKRRGFTCVAALTLALGIGANTAIFSLIDAVLLKRLPVENPERLALLRHANSRGTENTFAYRTYEQFRDQNQVLSGVLAYHALRLTVSVDGQPEPAVAGQLVSGNYYSVLGVNAKISGTYTDGIMKGEAQKITGTVKGNKAVFSWELKPPANSVKKGSLIVTFTGPIESPTRITGTIRNPYCDGECDWAVTKQKK